MGDESDVTKVDEQNNGGASGTQPNNDDKGGDNGGGASGTQPEKDDFDFTDDGQSPPDAQTGTPPAPPAPPAKPKDEFSDDDEEAKMQARISAAVAKEVENRMKPVSDANEKLRVDGEYKELLSKFPELTKFGPKILRFANHTKYRGQPISQAVIDVAGLDIFMRIGAKRAKAADAEAAGTRGGGTPPANQPPATEGVPGSKVPSFKGKTRAQIEQIKRDVARGKYA